jgi:hypothetical protein
MRMSSRSQEGLLAIWKEMNGDQKSPQSRIQVATWNTAEVIVLLACYLHVFTTSEWLVSMIRVLILEEL